MKLQKMAAWLAAVCLVFGMAALAGCSPKTVDPGPPPEDVIHPEGTETPAESSLAGDPGAASVLENAVSVRIGQGESKDWSVSMYNNAAANTKLGYLSSSSLLFPTYTYEEEEGFVAQNIRGSYTRDEETTIADIKAGELYLFSGGQLRLYFKDVPGANITATPVGYFAETDGLTEAVQTAYTSNIGDVWGVSVYFQITKRIG